VFNAANSDLFCFFRADEFIVNSIAGSSMESEHGLSHNVYTQSLHSFLYKNALLKRIHAPLRFCAVVQIDIFGLKQVVNTRREKEKEKDRAVPSQSMHQSPIDVFSISSLSRSPQCTCPNPQRHSDAAFFCGEPAQLSVAGARVVTEGSLCSSTKKIEPHVNSSNKRPTNDSTSPSTLPTNLAFGRNNKNGSNCTNYNSKSVLAQISQSLDYDFRTSSSFRFALPEGWLDTFHSEDPALALAHYQEELYAHIRCSPPLTVQVAVFEKCFFGDVKMGEAEIDMASLSHNK
jgi:hypothetical protein